MTYSVVLPERRVFETWRDCARLAISHRIKPDDIHWGQQNDVLNDLFGAAPLPSQLGDHSAHVPAAFMKLAKSVMWNAAPERFHLLYQALWRLDQRDGSPLLNIDTLGRRLYRLEKEVRRDIHKMHAFVRFHELPSDQERRRFGAWFEPDHFTLEPGSVFFAKRFADMDWTIATPYLTAQFVGGALQFTRGEVKPDLPHDASGELWDTYFANIFNPARIKLNAMRSEMPLKFWKNLPETRLIPAMLADAEARVQRMEAAGASTPRPGAAAISTRYRGAMPKAFEKPETLDQAKVAASLCRRCHLCEYATQTVWGEGAQQTDLMIVGEQPGDQEDLAGRPFIGPAGDVLRNTLNEVGLKPEGLWLTNAVKHFKFKTAGNKRLHQNPNHDEIEQCRGWLTLELEMVQPQLTVALGASAAWALTGDKSPLSSRRGRIEEGVHGGPVLITWHPSYILRLQDAAARSKGLSELKQDLAQVAANFDLALDHHT